MANEMVADVEYKDIKEFPGYKAGSDGTIWTCRNTSQGMTSNWRQLKGEYRTRGNNTHIYMRLQKNKKAHVLGAHTLVLLAFVGPRPEGKQCCHENDIGTDNRLSNLRWDTAAANIADRGKNNKTARGERAGPSKLTDVEALLAITLIRDGWTNKGIATKLGKCTSSGIASIRSGVCWSHLWDGGFVRIHSLRGTAAREKIKTEKAIISSCSE